MQPQQPLGCSYDAYQLIHPERIALGGGCTGAAAPNSRTAHHRSQIKREQSLALEVKDAVLL